MAATYNYKVDSFRIYKTGAPGGILTEDPFTDGIAPPDASETPPPPPPLVPSYSTGGGLSESGGKLIFDSNNSPQLVPVQGGVGQAAFNHQAIFNTNTDVSNTELGLKRNHEFAAEAVFDLTIPDENQQEYGVRFTDTLGSSGPIPDAIVGLSVHRGTDGRLWVELSQRQLGPDATITVKGRIELDPAGADQIRLRLDHSANSDFVTGSFELLTNDVSAGVVEVEGQARIFNEDVPSENVTRAAVYTTSFNIDENRATYVYELDSFRIERNGNNILVDQFNDGIAPPSINNQGGGTLITYNAIGGFSEVIEADGNGVLVMDSAQAQSATIGGEKMRIMSVAALTNNVNAQDGMGLKSNDDFGVYGRFNLILPQEERSEYGIRVNDFNSSPSGSTTGGDDLIALSVRMGTDGVVRLVLSDRNLTNGTMEILGTVELTPAILGTADQIGLGLVHDADNPGVITAGYRLFENGVELPGGPHPVPGFGQIFGMDTATTTDDEVWTRAQFFTTGIDPNGLNVIEGIEENDTLTGTVASETFYGHLGDDTFNGGGGTDNIFGGRGNDTVVLSGDVANYTISSANGVTTLIDNRGGSPDGTINARGVESFEFANGTFDAALLLAREIEVIGTGSQVIADNDTMPSSTDGTAFGSVNLGASLTQIFTINNLGGQTLTISNFKVPAGFTIVSPPPGAIPGGESATFEVAVNSSTVGTKSGQITFTTNDTTDGENAYNFAISANVVAAPVPEATVTGSGTQTNVNINDNDTAAALNDGTDFGIQEKGSTGIERTFTIRNDGTAPLVITNLAITGSGFTEGVGFSDVTLAQGETHTVTVQLDTSSEGAKSAQLTFNTNDPNEQDYNFAIKGNVTATPEILLTGNGQDIVDGDLTPDTINDTAFGDVLLGAAASRTFTIDNTGNGTLTISKLKLPAGFTLVGAAPTSILPGDSATIEVQIVGAKLGLNTGQVTFTTNDMTGGENAYNFAIAANVIAPEIAVTGTGTKANQNINDNDTSPSLIDGTDFGGVALNLDGTERTFTVRNDGTADLVISDLLVSGGFVLIDDLDDDTIEAGTSDTFTVKLDTSAPGYQTGQITFTTNDLTGGENAFNFAIKGNVTITPEVAVSGKGLDITINDLTPDVADDTHFGTANLLDNDPNLEHTFTVTNSGSAPLTITGLKLPKGFILVEGLSGPIAQNGGTDTFTVRLDTSKAGTYSGPITFTTNDPDEKAFKFQVTGVVVQPEIDVIGNNISIKDNSKKGAVANHTDFGPGIGLDDVGPTRTFTIRNTGVGDLVISGMTVEGTAFNLLDDLTGITIAGGAFETFEVELDTSSAGLKTGKVIINNNDANEAAYDFAISAIVGPRNVLGSDAADDEFVATVDPEAFNGMLGSDTVSYAGAAAVTASLLSPKANTGFATGDLYKSIENLIGTDFNDKLTGNAGNNVLEGGAGADTLDGGAGIDTASYANAAGGITADLLKATNNLGEAAGDTYKNIENLLGSAFGDTLIGNKSNNDINGGDGDDIIIGGLGKDNLTGGLGVDQFKFGLATEGGDTITDFSVAEDRIVIDKSGFKINADVDIGAADQFDFALHYFVTAVGAPATSANPSGVMATELGHGQFLFNETDSKLWWDADGLGKGKAVLIADLQDGVMLTANHFILDA